MKKVLLLTLLTLIVASLLVSCGETQTPAGSNETTKTPTSAETGDAGKTESATQPAGSETGNPGSSETEGPGTTETDGEADQLVALRNAALNDLSNAVDPVLVSLTDADLKKAIQDFADTEKQMIEAVNDLETAKALASKVVEDLKTLVTVLQPLAISKLNATVNPLISQIDQAEIQAAVQAFYDREIGQIEAAQSLSEMTEAFKKIPEDVKQFIVEESEAILTALKNKALEELDPYVETLIDKIPFDALKTDTMAFYAAEKKKLEAVTDFDGVSPCAQEIKDDLEQFVITEAKKIAIASLETAVEAGLDRLPNPDMRADLKAFAAEEIKKLNAVTKIEDVKPTLTEVLSEIEAHIKELLASTIKEYIARLTAVEKATAYDYLPAAMAPSYASNVVTATDIKSDFSSFVNTSAIHRAGFGEQWQMVVENIEQSVIMAKVFNVAQTALNAAGNAVDIYITNSYAEEMDYSFSGNGFTGQFVFKDSKLIFNINLTTAVNVPVVGSVKPVIKMEYDLEEEAKGIYISLGDVYKIKYVIREDGYEMAATYGLTIAGKSASRSTYLSIVQDEDGKTVGHIYEYTTCQGYDLIKACADFYVENGYVSVVGNKASGMIAFKGYVSELYLASEGRLLGYEVKEELEIAGVSAKAYNTLWFNLWDIRGINSVKATEPKSDGNPSSRSTADVYLNGSSDLFAPTYNKLPIIGTKTSRRYDVELRTRYYYTYDAENEKYVAQEVKVPMMFIQEEDMESFASDIKKDNGITASVTLNQTHLNKIMSDYDTLVDIFIQNKENMSSEAIQSYLAQYQ